VGRPRGWGLAAERGGRRCWPAGSNKFDLFQANSNSFKLDLIQTGPSCAPKKLKKYVFGGCDERNNFLHMDFSRFEMDFKLKFREVSMS
jgi:hypothetical protein